MLLLARAVASLRVSVQVKEKIIDQVYRNLPYSQRPKVESVALGERNAAAVQECVAACRPVVEPQAQSFKNKKCADKVHISSFLVTFMCSTYLNKNSNTGVRSAVHPQSGALVPRARSCPTWT